MIDVVVATNVQHALLALHEEWCGEGGTHLLVEVALRTSVATSLREGDAAAVWGHHAEVSHSQPVTCGHIRMGTAPESTTQPLTALTTNYSLHPACMHTAQCSRSHDRTVEWAESGVACGVICR